MIRKTIFWTHLVAGVLVGIVVFMMSLTGVLLTYERQMLNWADREHHREEVPPTQALPLEDILAAASRAEPDFQPTSMTLPADPLAPITLSAGRGGGTRFVDAYSGEILGDDRTKLRAFFQATTAWHRWFNAEGDGRGVARALTGASNLAFLFLVLTGIYLWLPPISRWVAFRTRLLFNPRARNAKARDYNWHHVFGIWSAIPLVVVVATAVVFSYGWANNLVFFAAGEEPPRRGAPPGAAQSPDAVAAMPGSVTGQPPLPLRELFAAATGETGGWQRMTVQLPGDGARRVEVMIDGGTGGQPQYRENVVLDRFTGAVLERAPFSSQSAGSRARTLIRYLHTGEALGIVGQTIAGIVSLASLLMVWTGVALAYRRLIQPLFHRA